MPTKEEVTPKNAIEQFKCSALTRLQCIVRRKLARKEFAKLIEEDFHPVYDKTYNQYFFFNRRTGKSTWTRPKRRPIKDPKVAAAISIQSAARTKLMDLRKERTKGKKMRRTPIGNGSKQVVRSFHNKPIKFWSVEDSLLFIRSINLGQYDALITEYTVDGLLLLSLSKDDWKDIGLANDVHVRKIMLHIKKFIVHAKNASPKLNEDVVTKHQKNGDDVDKSGCDELHGELENKLDNGFVETKQEPNVEGITIQKSVEGDVNGGSPTDGDIVEIHHTLCLLDSREILESSQNSLSGPMQFVLGLGDVIEGLEIALRLMYKGSKAQVLITNSELAYGKDGLPPSIPPNAFLRCEIELISFRKRNLWFKPYLQPQGLTQNPYHEDYYESGGLEYLAV